MGREPIVIERADDERIERFRAVRERDLLGAAGRPGLFIGESMLVVERMLARPGCVHSVFVEARHAATLARAMEAPEFADVALLVAERRLMESIAGFDVHRGVLALGNRPAPQSETLDAAVPRRPGPLTTLLCEDLTNPDNIGGLYRVAAAFGVDAVVLSPRCHDHLYRKCLRVSMGHALSVPTARSVDWPGDLDRLRREWGLSLHGAAIGADSIPLDSIDPPERTALLVGREFEGLSADTLSRCARLVRIPMAAGVDSLNVVVAAAVCLHRFCRAGREGNPRRTSD